MSTTNYDSEESLAKWRAATYIMEIKEKHLLSQAAVDAVISSTTAVFLDLEKLPTWDKDWRGERLKA